MNPDSHAENQVSLTFFAGENPQNTQKLAWISQLSVTVHELLVDYFQQSKCMESKTKMITKRVIRLFHHCW